MWRRAAQTCSCPCQASAEHFQQSSYRGRVRDSILCQTSTEQSLQGAEFLPLRNRGLRALAVTVLAIPLARRAAATACAAVQPIPQKRPAAAPIRTCWPTNVNGWGIALAPRSHLAQPRRPAGLFFVVKASRLHTKRQRKPRACRGFELRNLKEKA